ncbi:LLM class flavin-dependent oxidoreductase [Rhodococcus sp. IEGM 1307]|uniref:LLM class flavin-dependent oxidoreductase n=1 Tax=Rhodococcus sp. IEGM 1307 TaxID=3047091 RepID=UPI0024B70FB6|nr:LLM class flavin-dependent oxidoreductase [Rhodococcus sp. IEGM 1307]MDI9979597.1 LLM class flavin-dependent oxidoreductase [Rhodococcus sp. IEGM 1307]
MATPPIFTVLPSPPLAGGTEIRDSFTDTLALARRAEESGLDGFFLADSLDYEPAFSSHTRFEPLSLAGALLSCVERINVITTISTTFNHPYHIARSLTSLAHIGQGRIGVNFVTSFGGEQNFGLTELPTPDERYARAEEFIEVVRQLGRSWGPETQDPTPINYSSDYLKVKGPLSIKPHKDELLVGQSGQSPAGIELAAKAAQFVFTAAQLDHLQQRYFDALTASASTVRADGTRPTVLSGLAPIIGDTTEQAWEHERAMWGTLSYEEQLRRIEEVLGIDLSDVEPGDRFPRERLLPIEDIVRRPGRAASIYEFLENNDLSLAELVRTQTRHNGHRTVVGTADQVADEISRIAGLASLDGFIILLPKRSELVDSVFDELFPRLSDRGVLIAATDAESTRARFARRG